MDRKKITLIVGGAASGKSAYAETRVLAATGRPVYIATAEAHDDEMLAKIEAHRALRAGRGWLTVEAPLDVAAALAGRTEQEVVLLDCVTMWLSNAMLAGRDVEGEADRLIEALVSCPAEVTVVTNEVGGGIVPETSLGRRFRAAQGRLNQRLAARADHVVTVIAGLPLVLK